MTAIEEKRTLWKADSLDQYGPVDDGRREVKDGTHNLVSSLRPDGRHMPAIDLDIPHHYVPSSTEGHGHLYIDVPMTWAQYEALLALLYSLEIVEEGFYRLSVSRKASFLRKPGLFKGAPVEPEIEPLF
jgi:hypothetical protein